MATTSKHAKALTKRIKSLTKRVAALQEQSDHDPKDPVPAPDTSQDGDDDDKATSPCAFGKKRKIWHTLSYQPALIEHKAIVAPITVQNLHRIHLASVTL